MGHTSVTVGGCGACPFRNTEWFFCQHPLADPEWEQKCAIGPWLANDTSAPPECPLRDGKLVVELDPDCTTKPEFDLD